MSQDIHTTLFKVDPNDLWKPDAHTCLTCYLPRSGTNLVLPLIPLRDLVEDTAVFLVQLRVCGALLIVCFLLLSQRFPVLSTFPVHDPILFAFRTQLYAHSLNLRDSDN